MTLQSSSKLESILFAFILVVAYHAIPDWIFRFLPAVTIYERLGPNGYATFYDGLTIIMPLLLCIGSPKRSGLIIGYWRGNTKKILGICLLPIILTAIIYPFTSQPFTDGRVGSWLISPLAQDLMFSGFLFGLFDMAYSDHKQRRLFFKPAVLLTAFFFSLWHVPNFFGIAPTYVLFQLLYTFIGIAWMLLARQLSGSFLPVLITHMIINFISWKGW